MTMPNDLVVALRELERALAEFSAAHEAWLTDGVSDGELATLLAEAERRLDLAREALQRVQDALRA